MRNNLSDRLRASIRIANGFRAQQSNAPAQPVDDAEVLNILAGGSAPSKERRGEGRCPDRGVGAKTQNNETKNPAELPADSTEGKR